MTSKTILRAESSHLEVANCHLIFITKHLVKVKEWRGYKQVARQDANESLGEKAQTQFVTTARYLKKRDIHHMIPHKSSSRQASSP